MKTHTSAFKNAIKEYGRELDSVITYQLNEDTIELGNEELNSITPSFEGSILKSVMKQLILDSEVEIPIGTDLQLHFGVKVRDDTVVDYRDNYDYVNFGHYLVKEVIKKEDTQSYEIKCYDKMLYAMRDYERFDDYKLTNDTTFTVDKVYYTYINEYTLTQDDTFVDEKIYYVYEDNTYTEYDGARTGNPSSLGLYEYINKYEEYDGARTGNPHTLGLYETMYPITIREYINLIAKKIGLVFKNASDEFVNYNKTINDELFFSKTTTLIEHEGEEPTEEIVYTSLGYTYRDILDQLAEVTASTICINEADDQLEIRYINDTEDTIDEEYLKDTNVNFGEKYGPINSVVLSRSAESDNVYLQDEQSIEDNGLCEIKIKDNQIMNFDDRNTYLTGILTKLSEVEYITNDFVSTGITYYNLCDKYSVTRDNTTYDCIMFGDEISITQGLVENVHTLIPEKSETDYDKADKTDQKINKAMIMVNKQENTINSLVQTVNSQSDSLSTLTNTVQETITSTEDRIEVIESTIVNGVENLRNNLVTIDINGITVSTDQSEIETLMTNEQFKITSGDTTLAWFGYDSVAGETKAEMDNLTVKNYFVTGYHRFEKYEVDGEQRTGVFYIGE